MNGHRPTRHPLPTLCVLVALLIAVTGSSCGQADPDRVITVRVFAAASLTDVMVDLQQAFEAERRTGSGQSSEPTVRIELNLAGSSALRAQIVEGAPADVVATANPEVMDRLADEGLLAAPARPFTTNRLVLAVGPGDPDRIPDLAALADPDLFVGLCAPEVPCGALADRALAAAGIDASVDSREPDVRSLLAKIEAGELDAGLVYATDLAAADGVVGIELAHDLPARTSYPIAVVAGSAQPDTAQAFVDFVAGPSGQAILAQRGFGPAER